MPGDKQLLKPAGSLAVAKQTSAPGTLLWEPRNERSNGSGSFPCRTRYIQTELGFHERLFVAVLTSKATLNTLAVAVNKTVGHHFPHLLYFTGLRSAKVPHGMAVVSHGDERPVWLMYETVRYVHQHFGGDFDWFFVMQDDTYAHAEQVKALIAHLSINQDVYLGRAEEFIGGEEQARYCHGGFGYLLSRSLLLKLHPHLDSCRNEILSVRPDEWLGRCVVDFLGISCASQHQVLLQATAA